MGYPQNLAALMRVKQQQQPAQAMPATGTAPGGPQIQVRPPTGGPQPPNVAQNPGYATPGMGYRDANNQTWNQRNQTKMGLGGLSNPNDPAYQAIQQAQQFARTGGMNQLQKQQMKQQYAQQYPSLAGMMNIRR